MKTIRFKYPLAILLSFILFSQTIFASLPPDIIGESGFLMERTTGTIIYQKNANRKMYPASTTKVLTSILAIENLDLSSTVSKTNASIQNVPSDSSHIGLKAYDEFSIIDAVHAVMLGSDNYVSYDLATLLDGSIEGFANRMNAKARQIGANNSHFMNPHGYHDPNHYTTAHDLALIMDYAAKNDTFNSIIQSPSYSLTRLNDIGNPIEFPSTVKLIDPESPHYRPYNIGGKTGFTRAAGRSLVAMASQDNLELVGVVLKSESDIFFEDMNLLFDYGFENFKLKIKSGKPYLENNTFSPWAKDIVDFALEMDLIDNSAKHYQSWISTEDFIGLLMRTIYASENKTSDGFSNDLALNQALRQGLILNTSLLSGFYAPITREKAASISVKLLSSINYKPILVYPAHTYEDSNLANPDYLSSIYNLQQSGIMELPESNKFSPKNNLTMEEALSVATQIYKLYSISPYSFINAYQNIH